MHLPRGHMRRQLRELFRDLPLDIWWHHRPPPLDDDGRLGELLLGALKRLLRRLQLAARQRPRHYVDRQLRREECRRHDDEPEREANGERAVHHGCSLPDIQRPRIVPTIPSMPPSAIARPRSISKLPAKRSPACTMTWSFIPAPDKYAGRRALRVASRARRTSSCR